MKPTLHLGIDIGSTVVKAVVFDHKGRPQGSAVRPVRPSLPQPGWVERDPEMTWRAAAAAIRAAVGKMGKGIAGIGITGCGNGAVFLDERNRPVRAGILSSDTRAAAFIENKRERTRQIPYAGQLGSLLRWLREEDPAAAERCRCALFWKDFVRLRLTGETVTDFTDAGASGLLDVRFRRWVRKDNVLPPLRESIAVAGRITSPAARLTGLPEGTPVVTGCIDCEAAALGSGVSGKGELSLVAGTWAINQAFVSRLPESRDLFLCNPSVQANRWLVLEGSPTSASHFDWFVRAMRGRADFEKVALLAAKAPPGKALFLPRLFDGRGEFAHLSASDNLATMARAVMEAVAFSHRAHVEKLQAAGLTFHKARLAGGAARSKFWCQMFADVLGLPVEVPGVEEPGALGAALLAGVGLGSWPDLSAAQRTTVTVASRHIPRDCYESAFARHQEFLAHQSKEL